jgi:hypothetical protein
MFFVLWTWYRFTFEIVIPKTSNKLLGLCSLLQQAGSEISLGGILDS